MARHWSAYSKLQLDFAYNEEHAEWNGSDLACSRRWAGLDRSRSGIAVSCSGLSWNFLDIFSRARDHGSRSSYFNVSGLAELVVIRLFYFTLENET